MTDLPDPEITTRQITDDDDLPTSARRRLKRKGKGDIVSELEIPNRAYPNSPWSDIGQAITKAAPVIDPEGDK